MNTSRAHLVSYSTGIMIVINQPEVAIMAMNRIQFQHGLSMPEFLKDYGTETKCEQALEAVRWPNGFHCSRCEEEAHYVLRNGRARSFSVPPAVTRPR
jgi:hypothetical protein